jgi:hypothetical protein
MRDYFAPPRYWKWTRRTLIGAVVFFCVLYVQSYRREWSAAERVDLWVYLESGVWGSLSENSSTSYRLLEGVTAKKLLVPVVGDEIEAVTGPDGEPTYRLTEEGRRAYVRLEWRTSEHNDRWLHGFLRQWVYHDDLYESARRPFYCALVLLAVLLPVAVPKDRWPKFSYEKQWQKLMGFIARRRAAAQAKAAASTVQPPIPAPVARLQSSPNPPPVVAAKPPEARPAAAKKPRPRFE